MVTATARSFASATQPDPDGGPATPEVLKVGPLQIVPGEHIARVRNRTLTLSIRELCLLTELARRADRIMSREELFRLAPERSQPSDTAFTSR